MRASRSSSAVLPSIRRCRRGSIEVYSSSDLLLRPCFFDSFHRFPLPLDGHEPVSEVELQQVQEPRHRRKEQDAVARGVELHQHAVEGRELAALADQVAAEAPPGSLLPLTSSHPGSGA